MSVTPLAKYLKMIRKEHGHTQQDIADKLGITRAAYSHYETAFTIPSNEILDKLSKIYDIPLINLISLSAMQEGNIKDAVHKQCNKGAVPIFDMVSDNPAIDPLYIEYVNECSEIEDSDLRKWLTPDDYELVHYYHKLKGRDRRLVMYFLKLLILSKGNTN